MNESTATLRVTKSLLKAGNLAAANGVATWCAQFKGRVLEVEIALGSIGAVSGATTVDVKKNGTSILAGGAQNIAYNAAAKYVRVGVVPGPSGAGEPPGHDFVDGDVFTVDITAVPGTASTDLDVTLSMIAKNT